MIPSSRTPEGQPNRCPFCNKELRIEPSQPLGDAPCPCCGCLIWFDPATASDADRDAIEKGKRTIREKVHRIKELGKRPEIKPEEYFATFLPEVVSCLAAKSGAVWMRSNATLKLTYCVNQKSSVLGDKRMQDRHDQLLQTAFHRGESMRISPRKGGNPTNFLLLLSPIKVKDQIVGMLEIYQRAGAEPPVQRGYQRFLAQMCELAGDSLALIRAAIGPSIQEKKKTPGGSFGSRKYDHNCPYL
jgi:hypothetical protein